MKLNAKLTYSDTFLGIVPASNQMGVVSCLKSALRGTGFTLRRCGRNPNRQQFYHLYPTRGHRRGSQRGGLQQDLPLKHATHVALYLKPRDYRVARRTSDIREMLARALSGTRCGNGLTIKAVKAAKIHEVITAIAAW